MRQEVRQSTVPNTHCSQREQVQRLNRTRTKINNKNTKLLSYYDRSHSSCYACLTATSATLRSMAKLSIDKPYHLAEQSQTTVALQSASHAEAQLPYMLQSIHRSSDAPPPSIVRPIQRTLQAWSVVKRLQTDRTKQAQQWLLGVIFSANLCTLEGFKHLQKATA